MRKKIGVVGTIINDTIHRQGGDITHALGGILYTILPLRAFLPEEYEIVPVLHVGRDLYDDVVNIFHGLPCVSIRNVVRDRCDNNKVDLYYHNKEERTEIATGNVSSITVDEITGLGELDFLLINFVSGWELSLRTMQKLVRRCHVNVYSDMHSLMLGRREDGERYLRKPYGWKKWLECFYYVQMNHNEAETLTGKRILDTGKDSLTSLVSASGKIHHFGPKQVVITMGVMGAYLSAEFEETGTCGKWKARHRVAEALDPTGSGDVFLAAFASASILGKDPEAALSFAVRASALSTMRRGADGLYDYYTSSGVTP